MQWTFSIKATLRYPKQMHSCCFLIKQPTTKWNQGIFLLFVGILEMVCNRSVRVPCDLDLNLGIARFLSDSVFGVNWTLAQWSLGGGGGNFVFGLLNLLWYLSHCKSACIYITSHSTPIPGGVVLQDGPVVIGEHVPLFTLCMGSWWHQLSFSTIFAL